MTVAPNAIGWPTPQLMEILPFADSVRKLLKCMSNSPLVAFRKIFLPSLSGIPIQPHPFASVNFLDATYQLIQVLIRSVNEKTC